MDSNEFSNKFKENKRFEFPNRFKSFPIVVSTCFWLSENYNKLKETNCVTKHTCNLAESTIKNSIDLASPLINKFKDHVDILDHLACNQLDKLEAAFPIIKSNPDALVHSGKEMITNWTVEPAVKKLYNIKNSTEKKCEQVKNVYSKSFQYKNFNQGPKLFANRILDFTENILDKNLTVDKDKSEAIDKSKSLKESQDLNSYTVISQRSKIISLMIYRLFKEKLSENIYFIIELFKTYFLNLFKLIELYKIFKRNVSLKLQDKLYVTKDKIDLYKEYLDLIKKQFTVQDGRSLEHVHSLEERTKIIVRRNVGNLITVIRILYSNIQQLKPLVEQNRFSIIISHLLSDIYQIINKPDGSLVDILNSLLVECSNSINRIENLKNKINDINSSILQWAVPNFDAFGVLEDWDDDDDQHYNNQNLILNKAKSFNHLSLESKDGTIFDTDTDLALSSSRSINSYGSSTFSSKYNKNFHNSNHFSSSYSNSHTNFSYSFSSSNESSNSNNFS